MWSPDFKPWEVLVKMQSSSWNISFSRDFFPKFVSTFFSINWVSIFLKRDYETTFSFPILISISFPWIRTNDFSYTDTGSRKTVSTSFTEQGVKFRWSSDTLCWTNWKSLLVFNGELGRNTWALKSRGMCCVWVLHVLFLEGQFKTRSCNHHHVA